MMKIILTSWTPQKNLNSCLPGFPRPTLNAMRLGKAYEPFGQGEALIEVVRKRNKAKCVIVGRCQIRDGCYGKTN